MTDADEAVPGAVVSIRSRSGEQTIQSGPDGALEAEVPVEPLVVRVTGKNLVPLEKLVGATDTSGDLRLVVSYAVPPIHESIVIVDTWLDPGIDRRNQEIYDRTLFSRDDQLFDTLASGINAGQHEGGGKSLEVRRFGFNLDHGGVNGGLKVLVDGVQQNHGTQGHGQGYLGQLKSLTPELVQEVSILNGPFSAQYGDFSGLGVVHIRLKESLPDLITLRLQGGSFDSYRSFFAYSPALDSNQAYIAYELSRTDGPFLNPLQYKRDNLTGNFIWKIDEAQSIGFKINYGRNDYFSSGQIPLDEVAAGRLDRFGFLDPDNGGRVDSATIGVYYWREACSGGALKIDGFVSRSLFDLFSNFTFFLGDELLGDEVQQHDSRLQEGFNVQYLRPLALGENRSLLTAGGTFHDNQINVGLWRSAGRDPFEVVTQAQAHVTNGAWFVQQALDLFRGHLHIEGGLRYDAFRFGVDDRVSPERSGVQWAGRLQPKASVAWTPVERFPATLSFNYGRGITSQDARGVVQKPESPRIATTDFYQLGVALNARRVSLSGALFLIDRSNEQVYIPDDGTIELAGASRSYGFEAKSSIQIARQLSFNGGVTRVGSAF